MSGTTAARRAVLVLCVAGLVAGVRGQVQDDHALSCFDGPFEAVLLDGCVDDCRSFETLEEAEQHCNTLGYECGGITKTAYGDEDAISLGVGLYEVRSGPGIEQQQGDMTWIKQDGCTEQAGGTFPSSAGGYASDENYDARYTGQMDAVGSAYRNAVGQMVWMALFIGALGGAVFYSYRRGDRLTVQYVEKAREGVQQIIDRRGGRASDAAYQSL
ncbi:hypothetical protein T484DRAFT_1896272 [Baffinella frigidus]|nr:hypothetical protein T484DRAFT_1896272 [Cryptophyta sp. CCMP2293]